MGATNHSGHAFAITSGFTRQVKKFIDSDNVRWQLEGRDFAGVIGWLIRYDEMGMRRLQIFRPN